MTDQNPLMDSSPVVEESRQSLSRITRLFIPMAVIMASIGILPRLFGANLDPVSASMPSDTVMYMELDGLNLLNQNSLRIVEAFQEILDEAEVEFDSEEPEQLLEDIDKQLFEELGMTVSDDILPWLGPNVGFGLLDITVETIENEDVPNFIIALSVRDKEAADQFLQKLIDVYEEDTGDIVLSSEYKGVQTFVLDSDFEDEQFAFARASEALILATNLELLTHAIDAQDGDNLASNSAFKETMAQLPQSRIISAYISGDFYNTFLATLAEDPAFSELQPDVFDQYLFESLGMSISTTEHGIQIDVKVIYDEIPEIQRRYLEARIGEATSAGLLPQDTYLLLSGHRLDLYGEFLQDSIADLGVPIEDVEESMSLFEEQLGFNPLTELLPILDGEFAIAITNSAYGQIVDQTDINIGTTLLLETSDSDAMLAMVNDLNANLEQVAGISAQPLANPNASVFEINDPFLGGQILAYGVSDQYLIISSSDKDIEALFEEKATLAESEQFVATWAAFPANTTPSIYIDVAELFSAVAGFDSDVDYAARFNPMTVFAAGSQFEGNSIGSTIIFFIP